jgi:histidyl-tRNA synthetase
MFDNNQDNPRALFGWGRYNGLASIFWVKEDIPAIGFAPGDETMKLFLEGHWLLEEIQNTYTPKYYLPLLDWVDFTELQGLANILRLEWKNVNLWLSSKKLPKAIKYADKNNYSHIVILGEEELKNKNYIIKNLKTGEEEIIAL